MKGGTRVALGGIRWHSEQITLGYTNEQFPVVFSGFEGHIRSYFDRAPVLLFAIFQNETTPIMHFSEAENLNFRKSKVDSTLVLDRRRAILARFCTL